MSDKLREEIKEYWHQLHHYSLSTRVDKIIEIIERERKAAYAVATIRRTGNCDKCGRVAEDKDYTYFPDPTPGNEGWGDVLCDRCIKEQPK